MTYKPKYLSNQISLVRDTAYNKIKEIVAASDIVTPKVSEKLDITKNCNYGWISIISAIWNS